ncbi:MAG: glycosyltransferase family 39 protein [Anaerolineales bacterium]|nr:glycosyltransferase family 39 protein [Anaerolineales bacterium]
MKSPATQRVWPQWFLLWLALLLRVYHLDTQSIWFDEAARLLMARGSLSEVWTNAGGDTLPPFYHLLLYGWQQLGWQDFWVRLPSVWCGILLVAVVFRLAASLFDKRTGYFAALFAAFFPYLIYHSQQANLYSMLALLAGLQILFFYKAINHNRLGAWIGYGIFALLGWYTHYFAAFVTLALHIYWLWVERRYLFRLFVVDGIVVLLFLPQAARFLLGMQAVSDGFWLTKPMILIPLMTLYRYTLSYSLPGGVIPFAMFVTIGWLFLGMLVLIYAIRQKRQYYAPVLLLLLLIFVPIGVVWIISQWVPLYLDRSLLVTIPAYLVLLARFVTIAPGRSPVFFVTIVVLLLVGYSLWDYYSEAYAQSGYRQTAVFVASQLQLGDVVVHSGNGSYIPFLLYLPPQDHYLLAGDPKPLHPSQLYEIAGGRLVTPEELSDYQRIWLVVALDHSVGYQKEVAAEFEDRYMRLSEKRIQGLVVRLYQAKE